MEKKKKNFELYAYNIFLRAEEHQETTNLQFSIVLGRDSIRLPETLRTLSFDKHPIELGRDLSWFEWTSNTTKFSILAVKDSGIICQII